MNYPELTPGQMGRYDGYMDPSAESRGNNRSANSPDITEVGDSLLNTNGETDIPPANEGRYGVRAQVEAAVKKVPDVPTREYLVNLSRDILTNTNPGDVVSQYKLVEGWANIIKNGLPPLEKEKFKPILDEVIGVGQGLTNGTALARRSAIATAAQKIKNYFEKAKLIERPDYFKPITSFEEFMIKIADFTTKDVFRPGGKFQLLEISEEIDKFGRKIVAETAHPENFIQWTREQLEFFHDFTPLGDINLFGDIAIPTATRPISLGEIIYGATSDTYFAHRVPKITQVYMDPEELARITRENPGKFSVVYPTTDNEGNPVKDGTYTITNDNGTKEIFKLKVGRVPVASQEGTVPAYLFFDEAGKPVTGIDPNKDNWTPEEDKGFNRAKEDVMWEAHLLTNFHNYSVRYQLKGMPNEGPLKEQMAEIYGTNMMTRNRNRLFRMLRMQSVEKADEVKTRLENDAISEDITQGSVGKGMQRALAGYYHLAEASAAASGYSFDSKDVHGNPLNAFTEVMRGKDTAGAEEFYKGLINETLNEEFGNEVAGIKELVKRLNAQRIAAKNDPNPEGRKLPAESLRDRKDYEKVQISEAAFLSRSEFLRVLQSRYGITQEEFTNVYNQLANEYSSTHDAKLDQLKTIGDRGAVLKLLDGKKTVDVNAAYMQAFINAKNGWQGLDVFAVNFYTQPFAKTGEEGGSVDNANIWENISDDLIAQDRVRKAMRHAVSQTEKLSDFESLYAEEFAFSIVYQTGISARNDMKGIGHDAWSKIQNTEFYRLRQTGGGNYPGNLDNLYGIHRLGLNFWEGLKVRRNDGKMEDTVYEVITGLKDGRFDVNKDIGVFDFYGNAERQFFADHLGHVIDLFIDITQKHEFNFDKIVKTDQLGRVTIDHAEMQKLIDSTWKHMRYGFDNRSFLYDKTLYGWWYDEKLNKEGQVSRTPRFGFKTIRGLMFSEEVQSLQMYNRTDVSGWKPGSDKYKMGRNVFAYLIKAQFEEHTKRSGMATIYTADQIALIAEALMNYTARVMKGEHGEAISLSGFFTPEEMYRIMFYAHAILWHLYAKEYGVETFGGFLSGLFQAMSLIMKNVGAGITLKS